MSPPAQHYVYDSYSYDASAYDGASEEAGFDEVEEIYVPAGLAPLTAGDRIGAQLMPKRGRRMLRWGGVLLLCLGAGWAVRDDTGTVPALIEGIKTTVAPVLERVAIALAPPPAAPPATSPLADATPAASEPPPLPAAAEIAPASVPAASVAVASPAAGILAEPEAAVAARPKPLPPPVVDEADPYQKRAAAVGLHPGISAAVLKSLTPTDYRNAGAAIEKALRETPDTGILAWPKPAGAGVALFQVRFVQGSNAACRRYLVNVTKDGWSTTAPAMEKCGIRAPGAKAAKAAE